MALVGDRRAGPRQVFDEAKLPTLAKWSAGGFATLTGMLTFFGIKDAFLEEVLSENVTVALWVIVTVAAGVVLATFALAASASTYVDAWLVIACASGVASFTGGFLKDIGESAWANAAAIVFAVLMLPVFVVAIIRSWQLPVGVALILVASVCTSAGLYSAAKVSLVAKAGPEDLQVRAKMLGENDTSPMQISLAGSKQRKGAVVVVGYRAPMPTESAPSADKVPAGDPNAVVLWRTFFTPDKNAVVAETYTVRVQTSQWSQVSVLACTNAPDETSCKPTEQQTVTYGRALVPPAITGTLSGKVNRKVVTAKVEATGLLNNEYLRVWVEPQGGRKSTRLSATSVQWLAPDASGQVGWAQQFAAIPGVRMVLLARRCAATPVVAKGAGGSSASDDHGQSSGSQGLVPKRRKGTAAADPAAALCAKSVDGNAVLAFYRSPSKRG